MALGARCGLVGQPILAAAGFQPARAVCEDSLWLEKLLERRLQVERRARKETGLGHLKDRFTKPSTKVFAKSAISNEPELSGLQSGFAMPSTVIAMAILPDFE